MRMLSPSTQEATRVAQMPSTSPRPVPSWGMKKNPAVLDMATTRATTALRRVRAWAATAYRAKRVPKTGAGSEYWR